MTEKERYNIEVWCQTHLGYVPTEEEWLAVNEQNPGLVALYIRVFSDQFMLRTIKQEKYDFSKRPNVQQLKNNPDVKAVWTKEKLLKKEETQDDE